MLTGRNTECSAHRWDHSGGVSATTWEHRGVRRAVLTAGITEGSAVLTGGNRGERSSAHRKEHSGESRAYMSKQKGRTMFTGGNTEGKRVQCSQVGKQRGGEGRVYRWEQR